MYTFRNATSNAISKIGYDKTTKRMAVIFHHGREYEYEGVSEDTFKQFINAPSIGKFYNQHVKGLLPK